MHTCKSIEFGPHFLMLFLFGHITSVKVDDYQPVQGPICQTKIQPKLVQLFLISSCPVFIFDILKKSVILSARDENLCTF